MHDCVCCAPCPYIGIVEVGSAIGHECFWQFEHEGDVLQGINSGFCGAVVFQIEAPDELRKCVEDK